VKRIVERRGRKDRKEEGEKTLMARLKRSRPGRRGLVRVRGTEL
jgi:hypothetical protein